MPAPSVTILYNNSRNDLANSGGSDGDANWKPLDAINDRISFLNSTVYDGDSNASRALFKIPESGNVEIPKQCVSRYAEGIWKRVYLAGSDLEDGSGGNYQHVYGAYIDGTSNSAPVLQAWDSTAVSTFALEVLGNGTPANSMIKAIATTDGVPGEEWVGIPLAGDGGDNSIALDDGPVTSPKMIYWNMRMVVPSTASPFAANPILCIYLTYQ